MDYVKIWEIIEEWQEMEFKPVKECIAWLNNDDRVEIFNIYNDTDYDHQADGMALILEQVEEYDNGSQWIEWIIEWIGSYEASQLIENIEQLYNL